MGSLCLVYISRTFVGLNKIRHSMSMYYRRCMMSCLETIKCLLSYIYQSLYKKVVLAFQKVVYPYHFHVYLLRLYLLLCPSFFHSCLHRVAPSVRLNLELNSMHHLPFLSKYMFVYTCTYRRARLFLARILPTPLLVLPLPEDSSVRRGSITREETRRGRNKEKREKQRGEREKQRGERDRER